MHLHLSSPSLSRPRLGARGAAPYARPPVARGSTATPVLSGKRRKARLNGNTDAGDDSVEIADDGLTREDKEKEQRLRALTARINTKFGHNTIWSGDGSGIDPSVQFISTGCTTLDMALGGGFPRGRIIEIFGQESCGKTSLALATCAELNRQKQATVYVDVEMAMDYKFAKRMGCVAPYFQIAQPSCAEDAFNIIDEIARSGDVSLIVLDSVSALALKSEMDSEFSGTMQPGTQARFMSSVLRKIAPTLASTGTSMVFINQLRSKIGLVFGNPETTSGGWALKYYASQRIQLYKKESLMADKAKGEDARAIGIKVRAKVVKNKVGPPFRECFYDFYFRTGIDSIGALFDSCVAAKLVERRGSTYTLVGADGEEGQKIGVGRDKCIATVKEDKELKAKMLEAVKACMEQTEFEPAEEEPDPEELYGMDLGGGSGSENEQ